MSKIFQGSYVLGGISARTLDALLDGLLADAREADGQPDVSARDRHVNTAELRRLATAILEKTVDEDGR